MIENNIDYRTNQNSINCKNPSKSKNGYIIPRFKKGIGMKGEIKIFDQELSDRFDKRSRMLIKSKLGPTVKDNPNKYAEDMLVMTDMIPYKYIELQVYGKWIDEQFPYESPFIYERKMKFDQSTLFICFNASFDRIIIFERKAVNPKLHCLLSKFTKIKEYINYVPWSKTITLDTNKLSTTIIKNYYDLYNNENT